MLDSKVVELWTATRRLWPVSACCWFGPGLQGVTEHFTAFFSFFFLSLSHSHARLTSLTAEGLTSAHTVTLAPHPSSLTLAPWSLGRWGVPRCFVGRIYTCVFRGCDYFSSIDNFTDFPLILGVFFHLRLKQFHSTGSRDQTHSVAEDEWHAWLLTVENRIQGSQQEALHCSSAEHQFDQNDCRLMSTHCNSLSQIS